MRLLDRFVGIIFFLILTSGSSLFGQETTLDEFETKDGWSFIKSDGVELALSNEPGHSGQGVRFDYQFTKGTGYGGIQKKFPLELPDNY